MAAVSDHGTNERLDGVFRSVFFVSKWLGLFPFVVKNGKFKRSPLMYAISMGIVGMCTTFVWNFVSFDNWVGEDHLLKKLSQFLPIFTIFTVLPCNIVWLTFNGHKLAYVLDTLKRLEMKPQDTSNVHVYKKVFVLVLVCVMFLEVYYIQFYAPQRQISIIYMFMVLSTFLIADQFASVLAVLRRYYEDMCEALDLGTAVDLTNAHDLLGKCCREVNDSYSPQLLLIMISVFVYIVSGLYTLIVTYLNEKTTDIVQVYYIIMFVATIFHFLTACRLTTLQSKKFDNLLYRLIINDKSKSLMRNNRILLHFKAMKDLEFSAMEFFNFDYSLICSVVSTATTYIVILVQFSQ